MLECVFHRAFAPGGPAPRLSLLECCVADLGAQRGQGRIVVRDAGQARTYHHALATGFSRGYLVSAGVLALILIIALFVMRVSRQDLSGADPEPTTSPNPSAEGAK